MTYTINCIVLGENIKFQVDANEAESVHKLKRAIRTEKDPDFNGFSVDKITLYQIKSDENYAKALLDVSEGSFDLTKEHALDPLHKLVDVFSDAALPEDKVHILVVPPQRVTTPRARLSSDGPKRKRGPGGNGVTAPPPTHVPLGRPLEHTPTKPQAVVDGLVEGFLDEHRLRMRELASMASKGSSLLESWEPKPLENFEIPETPEDEIIAKHIKKLSIPWLSSGNPSLLLHGLGEETDDIDRKRIARIFAATNTALINTSGSGKTRLLLEGLCCRWGFYFVAQQDTTGIGSNDLWQVISELGTSRDYTQARWMTECVQKPATTEAGYQHMKEVAERRFAQLLLARFLLLNLLVQEARNIEGGLQPKEHRRLWVLLQAQPAIFEMKRSQDIFIQLTRLLQWTPTRDLKDWIGREREKLEENIDDGTLSIFCVLDEVQITLSSPSGRLGEFMSKDKTTKRHILREIWLSWSTVLRGSQMRLVPSGTGIELRVLEDTMASTSLKPFGCLTVHETGSFEDDSIQAKYIRKYLPASLDGPTWAGFFTRACAWFHGRYRNTATLITLILQGGYRSPHRTIDEYVEAHTGFRPTDGKIWADRESPLPTGFISGSVTKLNFEKMNPAQAMTLRDILYDQLLYGKYNEDLFSTPQKELFVEYGFARHLPTKTVIDEPLAILAARQWVDINTKHPLSKYLQNNIRKHVTRQNGFEVYLAFYFRAVFENTPVLDAIFTFRGDFAEQGKADLAWQHEQFELVTVVHSGNELRVSVVTPSSGPSSNVGSLANSPREVLDWVSTNTSQYAFCFPLEPFGPDLLFFVRSKVSGKLLLVALQAKHYIAVDNDNLIKGIRTVTPSWFWKSKDTKHTTADIAPFIKLDKDIDIDKDQLAAETKNVLAKIPHGLKGKGADYPVLRVFASWPGEAKLERTQGWKEPNLSKQPQRQNSDAGSEVDPDRHPLAALRLDTFMTVGNQLDDDWFQGVGEQKVVVSSKKRAREEEDSESPVLRKRPPKEPHSFE